MGKKCSLKNCKNYQKEPSYGCEISFHGLPKNEAVRKKWLEAIPKDLIRENASTIYICGAHFTPESFQPSTMCLTKNMLRRTAVPSIFGNSMEPTNTTASMAVAENVVSLVNTTDQTVFIITKTEPSTAKADAETCPMGAPNASASNSKTCDVGIQVCLPTTRERDLQRKLYTLHKRLERREARISSIMTDFKTLMDS